MTNVKDNDGNNNGVKHTDYGDGEFDNIAETKVGNHQTKKGNVQAQPLVGYLALTQFVEVAADRSGDTDRGGDAGAENNQRQDDLTGETHVVYANHIQQLATVGNDTESFGADSTCIGQGTVNQSKADGGNNTCVNYHACQQFVVLDTLVFNGFNYQRAKEQRAQKIHGVIAFLETLEESGILIDAVGGIKAAHGIGQDKDNQHA